MKKFKNITILSLLVTHFLVLSLLPVYFMVNSLPILAVFWFSVVFVLLLYAYLSKKNIREFLAEIIRNIKDFFEKNSILSLFFAFFIIMFFLTSSALKHQQFYFYMILPIFLLCFNWDFTILKTKTALAALVYISIMLVSFLWSGPKYLSAFPQYATSFFVIITFILLVEKLTIEKDFTYIHFIAPFIVVAIAMACYNAYIHTVQGDLLNIGRFYGVGRGSNPMKTAEMYSVVVILLSFFMIAKTKNALYKFAYIFLAALSVLFIIGTQTKGALIALGAVFMIYLLLKKHYLSFHLFAIPLTLLLFAMHYGYIEYFDFIMRDSQRIEVWQEALKEIAKKPVLGHGIVPDYGFFDHRGYYIGYFHNVFLHSHYVAGFLGSLSILVLFATLFWQSIRIFKAYNDYTCLALVMFCFIVSIVDFGHLLQNAGVEWIVFWLPIALIATFEKRLACNNKK